MTLRSRSARFRPLTLAADFPDEARTLIVDHYMTDEPSASSRVFRVYAATPPHFHRGSDEFLYVLSGEGTFWMESPANSQTFAPGDLLYFQRGVVHALPTIVSGPVVFLAIDTPRRDPKDIVFVDPEAGTPESFVQELR